MNITAYFSQIGVPKTGLSPTVNIRDISDGSLVVSAAAMTEVGDGFYRYNFSSYNAAKDYSIRCDGGATLFDSDRYAIASTGFPADGSGFTAIGDARIVNLDAAISSRAPSGRLLMVDTTIATLASQTSFTLTAGSADDNAYNNCTIIIEDASTTAQKAVGIISDYTGATKTIILKYDPAIFTMATTDKVYILAENALKSTLANRQLNVAADGDIAGNIDGSVASVVGHIVQTGDGYAILNNGTHGNAALETLVDEIETILKNATYGNSALQVLIAALQTDLDNGTDGLGALKTLIDRILTATEITQSSVNDVGATTTKFITNLTETDNDFWNRGAILFTSGNNSGQMRRIKDYNGSTKEITVQTILNAAPADADTFVIVAERAFLTVDIPDIADAVLDELTAGHVGAGSLAKAVSDILVDTNDLQTNQGNWATATGFSTHNAAAVKAAIEAVGSKTTFIKTAVETTIPNSIAALPTDADVNAACDLAISDAALATAAILKEINQSLNGAKCVVDRAANTFKVYDIDGVTPMFTITKTTVENVDILTRT